MKRIKFLFTLQQYCWQGVVSAQNITVKGTVADRETGEPIPLASIQVGTTAGVAADVDGRFTIDVASNATLSLVSSVTRPLKYRYQAEKHYSCRSGG